MRRKCTEQLIQWKKKPDRRLLILQGIRQSGKTWLLRDFGSRQYRNTVYVNLETDRPAAGCFCKYSDPEEVLLFLESYTGQKFRNTDALLIIDNLQYLPSNRVNTLCDLWDFCCCDIIAAERGLSNLYDSGETEIMKLYPLDFEEFLWANSEFGLSREIRAHFSQKISMGKELHEKALAQYRLYLATGGMPEAVQEYRKEKSLLMVPDVQQKILDLIQGDIISHAPEELAHHCRNCWLSVPGQLGKENVKFRYRPVTKSGSARLYQKPIRWLTDSGLALRSSRRTEDFGGLDAASFRLYFPDVGLTACHLKIPPYLLLSGEETVGTRSCLETFLAQQFIRSGYALSYWRSSGRAEVPFLLGKDGSITAVDFRMTSDRKIRALSRLTEICPATKKILLSTEDFRFTDKYDIIPIYAAFCI